MSDRNDHEKRCFVSSISRIFAGLDLALLLALLVMACGCSGSSDSGPVAVVEREHYFQVTIDAADTDSFTIGRMYGEAVLRAVPDYEALVDAYLSDLSAFAAGAGGDGAGSEPDAETYAMMISRALEIRPRIPPEYLDELDGFASVLGGGASDLPGDGELSANEFLLLNLVPDIVSGLTGSAVAVYGDRSETGQTHAGRVIDRFSGNSGQMDYVNAVVHLRSGLKEIVSIGWLGVLGVQAGINSDGVFVACLSSPLEERDPPDGPGSLLFDIRKAMEICGTIASAAEYLQDENKRYGFHHNIFLADRFSAMVLENDFDAYRAIRDETAFLNPGVEWGVNDALACVNSFVLAGNHDNHTPVAFNVARWESFKTGLDAAGDRVGRDAFQAIVGQQISIERETGIGNTHGSQAVGAVIYSFADNRLVLRLKSDDTSDAPQFVGVAMPFQPGNGWGSYKVILTLHDHINRETPIADARFYSHSCANKTDSNGRAEFYITDSDTENGGGFNLQHPDYLPRLLRYQDFQRENDAYHLDLTMVRKDQPLPAIVEARVRPSGGVEEYDVLTEPVDFMRFRPDSADISLKAEARGFHVTGYRIQQGTVYESSASGTFQGLKPGEKFAVGKPVFAVIETDFKDLHITVPLRIRIRKNPDFPEEMETMPESATFQVPEGIPMLEKLSAGIGMPMVPVSGVFDGNQFTLAIGVKGAFENGKWLTPKSLVNDMENAFRDVGSAQRFLRENGGSFQPMENADCWNAEVGIMGYLEFSMDDRGKLHLIGGRAMIFGGGSVTVTNQFVIVVVPVFISGTVGSTLSVEFAYEEGMGSAGDFFASATLGFAPFVELEAGVGVKGILSVSVAGRGTVPISYRPKDDQFKVQLTLGAELRAVIFVFLTYTLPIAEQTWELYPHPGDPPPLFDADVLPGGIFDMASYQPEPRSRTGPIWVGDQPPLTLGPVTEQVLIKNILPGAEPLLVRFGSREALLWIDDVHGRADNNRSALKFMIRWVGGKWGRPKIVSDTGTADVAFHAVAVDNALYVAWQNVKESMENVKEENLLREMTRLSQVHVARYHSGEYFVVQKTFNDGAFGYRRPRLATDGQGKLSLFFSGNDDARYFADKGTNFVEYADFNGYDWHGPFRAMTTSDMLVSCEGTYGQASADGWVVSIIDMDRDLRTIDDRTLRMCIAGGGCFDIMAPGRIGHPRFARFGGRTVLFWFQDGNILYNTDPFTFEAENTHKLFTTPPSGLTDDYNLMTDTDSGEVRAVLWVDNDMDLDAEACASFYNPETGDWGEPVPITRSGMRVEAPQGFLDKNGRAQIAYRRLKYDTDSEKYNRGASDLVVADVAPSVDLTLGENAIVGDAGSQIPGKMYGFEATVANHGTVTCKGVRLEILDAHGHLVNTMDFPDTLLPGASKILKGQYPVPDPLTRHAFQVRVRPVKGEDKGTSTKTASCTIGIADVRIPKVSIWRGQDGKRYTRVHIRNANHVTVPDVRLEIKEASGETVRTGGPWRLGPNQSELFEFHETVNEEDDPTYNHRRSYLLVVSGVDAYPTAPIQSVTVNPFHLNAITPSIHRAEQIENTVEVTVALVNNHPVRRGGTLVVELCDQNGSVVGVERMAVSLEGNAASAVSMKFTVPGGRGRRYTARASVPHASLSGSPREVMPGAAILAPNTDDANVSEASTPL